MCKKLFSLIVFIFAFNVLCFAKVSVEALVDKNYTDNIFKSSFNSMIDEGIDTKKINIKEKGFEGAKEFLIKVNKMLSEDNIQGLIENFGNNIEFFEDESEYYKKDEFLKSNYFKYFQQLFLSENYLKTHNLSKVNTANYNSTLKGLLENENIANTFYIFAYLEKDKNNAGTFKYYVGSAIRCGIKSSLGFTAEKINGEWKITIIAHSL